MYVVDPLPWCPHLESVRPVPAGGIDVFLPCEECGSDTENWICLFCYKVTAKTTQNRCAERIHVAALQRAKGSLELRLVTANSDAHWVSFTKCACK